MSEDKVKKVLTVEYDTESKNVIVKFGTDNIILIAGALKYASVHLDSQILSKDRTKNTAVKPMIVPSGMLNNLRKNLRS